MKYTGSKSRINKDICAIINKLIQDNNIDTYIEPFVGGANVVENVVCEKKICSDNNEFLIALWRAIQNNYNFPSFISREDWLSVKTNIETYPKEYVGLVGILASYNGFWFTSYGGYSKTKIGKDRNYYQEAVNNVLKQKSKILDVDFRCCDYKNYLGIENTLIYCDPPYRKRKDTYQDKQFNHNEFWEWVRKLSENNIVLTSEYDPPSDFEVIWEKQLAKTFPNQTKQSPTEKLIRLKVG